MDLDTDMDLTDNHPYIEVLPPKGDKEMQTSTRIQSPSKKATDEKKYPETLKGCFSFDEFQDILNEKIRQHYEKV